VSTIFLPGYRAGNLAAMGAAAAFSPLSLSPILWLKADAGTLQTSGGTAATADADPIGQHLDQSGNGNHAVQATGNLRPTLKLNIQNTLPSVRYLLSSFQRMKSPLSGLSAYSIFVVGTARSLAADATMLDIRATGSGTPILANLYLDTAGRVRHRVRNDAGSLVEINTGTGVASANVWLSVYAGWDGAALELRVNGGTAVTGSFSGATTIDGVDIPYGTGSDVDHGEILIFPTMLSTSNRQAVESYIRTRWGTP
jgi:hypothetical protein